MQILVVAAHPDDELLGCGGAVASLTMAGHSAIALILGEGGTSRRAAAGKSGVVSALAQCARDGAAVLGAEPPLFGSLPDQRFDEVALLNIVHRIEDVKQELNPDLVLTHHGNDLNNDHRVTHRAVLAACRPLPDEKLRGVFTFETVSSTEWGPLSQGQPFRPQIYVDITATLERKLKSLACYPGEMRPFPHPRSLEAVSALAKRRGSEVGIGAAEAFEVVWARGGVVSASGFFGL